MRKLSQYHFSLINHFNPAEISPGFWYDYVTRLSNKDAKLLFKKCQYNSLKLIYKPKRSQAVAVMQQNLREVRAACKRKNKPKYKASPQASRKDKVTKGNYVFKIE